MSVLLLLLACTNDSDDSAASVESIPSLEAPPAEEGFQMAMTGVAPAYAETWLCNVYDLPTTDVSAVNRVEFLEDEGMHHMTVSTTALGGYQLENGTYNCEDLYADPELMEAQTTIFGNQGSGAGETQLPEGVVAMIPAGIQVVHEVHYVNATAEDVPLYSYVNAWTIPQDEVTDTIWGGQVRDEVIRLPAQQTTTEWTRCAMNQDVQVHFLASHTHGHGSRFTIARFDGATTGAPFYENTDWHDPKITQYAEPLDVPAGQGFEFACTWDNTTDQEITYGFSASDEMCNMTLVFTPGNPSAKCEVVASSDEVSGG